jgi:error-prone DNA polymerase
MGFYAPAVLVKDAQRHGLRVRPIDVQRSEWLCTLESEPDGSLSLRIGMNYAKGLRQSAGEALLTARINDGPFKSIDDLARRVPSFSRKELVILARIGALNALGEVEHRRDALWQVEQAGRPVGPLLRNIAHGSAVIDAPMPLKRMSNHERLSADYAGTGLTTGPHPLSYHRAVFRQAGMVTADDLSRLPNNQYVRIAGCVIARQRPGTAKGFVFLSLEDETGIANVIFTPDSFEKNRVVVTRSRFVRVEGPLQQQDGVIHIKAHEIIALDIKDIEIRAHNFH